MGRYIFYLFWICLVSTRAYSQSHGLQFSSHEVVPEKRTSLNITPTDSFCLHRETEISFDLQFRPDYEIYFGYILRIITGNNQNIDLVYNQKLRNFNFVIGESFSCVFAMDSLTLFSQWNNFRIKFTDKKDEVVFFLNNRAICKGKTEINENTCYKLFFGTNDFEGIQTVDIPPMNIKDIRIKEGQSESLYFRLAESEGNQALDQVSKKIAVVKNPVWIRPRHQNWQKIQSFNTKGTPSLAFDEKSEDLFIIAKDSLYTVSIKNLQQTGTKLSKNFDALPPGNQSIFNGIYKKLNNFYIDEHKVGSFDAAASRWDVNYTPGALTEFWHANKFLSPSDSSLYIFGGYGQLQYKNLVQRYHFPSRQWEIIHPKGETFIPRYMAGLGANATKDTVFIIGGYGSNTGDQTINPKYIYDLTAYSVKDQRFHKIYHLKDPEKQFCFANSLFVDTATRDFYALVYPTDRFNSSLRLIKGSLQKPEYRFTGDTIPYSFYDIKSFADLYYAPDSKKLVAITLYTSRQDVTTVNVYTLEFPPNDILQEATEETGNGFPWPRYLVGGAVLFAVVTLVYFLRKNKKSREKVTEEKPGQAETQEMISIPTLPEPTIAEAEPLPVHKPVASVFLFGQLEVFDKDGHDATKQFTPLVKELFLLILIYTLKDGKGISTDKLYEILWSDKSAKDARNNYSVNVAKLKTILDKVGEYHITREADRWKFEIIDDSIQVDYQRFVNLTSGKGQINRDYIIQLANIIQRGAFLSSFHYSWLDDIKSEVSTRVIDNLIQYLSHTDPASDPELALKLANYMFYFDQLSEEALLYKCRALILLGRHGMARDAYQKFSKEYAENYGHPFEKSFSEIAGH